MYRTYPSFQLGKDSCLVPVVGCVKRKYKINKRAVSGGQERILLDFLSGLSFRIVGKDEVSFCIGTDG